METQAIRFHGGIWPLVVFILLMALLPIGLFTLVGWLFPEGNPWVGVGTTVLGASVIYGLSWGVLHWDGLRPADVGLSRSHVLPGLLPVVGLWVGLNGLAAILTWVVSGGFSFQLSADTNWPLWIATAVEQWFFVGPAEELGARAYLQNKLIALLGGGRSRQRKAVGTVLAALLFALWHIPQRLWTRGLAPSQAVLSALGVLPAAFLDALLYEVTRNVIFVGFWHGTDNHEPFFFPQYEKPQWVQPVMILSGLVLLGIGVWLYRRWAIRHRPMDFRPVVVTRGR